MTSGTRSASSTARPSATTATCSSTGSARPTTASPSAAAAPGTTGAAPSTRRTSGSARCSTTCTARSRDLFPAVGDARDHPPLGRAARRSRATGTPTASYNPKTGVGFAGGYVGDGLSTTNLAGRTLADLVLGSRHRADRAAVGQPPLAVVGARAAALRRCEPRHPRHAARRPRGAGHPAPLADRAAAGTAHRSLTPDHRGRPRLGERPLGQGPAADERREQRRHRVLGVGGDGLFDEQPGRRTHAECPREPGGHAQRRAPGARRARARRPSAPGRARAGPGGDRGAGRLAEQQPRRAGRTRRRRRRRRVRGEPVRRSSRRPRSPS